MEPLAKRCPFCGAAHTECVGRWGGQMITEQWRCHACASYFEAIRDDFAGDVLQVTPDIRESDDTRHQPDSIEEK
jgi:sarcosine oxidase delta subunit